MHDACLHARGLIQTRSPSIPLKVRLQQRKLFRIPKCFQFQRAGIRGFFIFNFFFHFYENGKTNPECLGTESSRIRNNFL